MLRRFLGVPDADLSVDVVPALECPPLSVTTSTGAAPASFVVSSVLVGVAALEQFVEF